MKMQNKREGEERGKRSKKRGCPPWLLQQGQKWEIKNKMRRRHGNKRKNMKEKSKERKNGF